ncbi:SDR family oxidoreductase [Streptomyces sp. NPDC098789]|uniref:SDR family oxidoreductase n=1 Tax=Streptomyces sp. NPDC098789 TaxID=3366098 RepID=UPI00381C2870
MSIAMTGATGFLGSRLLPALLQQHDTVRVLARGVPSETLDRIHRALVADRQPSHVLALASARVEAVDADIEHEDLGLSPQDILRITDGLEAVWHCAAATSLNAVPQAATLVNVAGTLNILRLATAAPSAVFHHISTAFVAGRQREGIVREEAPAPAAGFENPYEESKSQAESLVHEWARRRGRKAVIFRPSILVSDRPGLAQGPKNPVRVMAESFRTRHGREERTLLRIPGLPHAHLNLIPVERAAELMTALASKAVTPPGHTETFHITHPWEVSYRTMLELLESLHPVRFEFVETKPLVPTPAEYLVYQVMRGYLPYAFHQRQYDRSKIQNAGLDRPADLPVTLTYLQNGMPATDRDPFAFRPGQG